MTIETDQKDNTTTSSTSPSLASLPTDLNTDTSSSSLTSQLPWVEKYRPAQLTELISHTDIIHTLQQLIQSNRLPHLLLYGSAGVGKTTTALAIARLLNGPNFRSMVLELNASDDRGIGVVREQIKDFASSRQLFNKGLKLIILDECDSMTSAAQFALRRIIEKYTRNVRFCLLCNYVNKIIPALQSRCTKFRFGPLQQHEIEVRLKQIAEAERCNMTAEGLQSIIKLSGGDMRKCLNVLQACHMAYDEINEINVHLCTGTPLPSDIESIQHLLFNESTAMTFAAIQQLQQDKGLAVADIVQHLHELLLRTELPPKTKCLMLDKLSEVEHRLLAGCSEKLQLAGLVGIYQIAKQHALKQQQQQQTNMAA